MFSTQLTGIFQRINEQEEYAIEDGARLLAQATVGEGHIYIQGFQEMAAVSYEALHGKEQLFKSKLLTDKKELLPIDRVLIITRYAHDPEAVLLGQRLSKENIPFVAISGISEYTQNDLTETADIHIDTKVVRGLIPDNKGKRVGFPSSIAGLYIYHLLKMTIDEMVSEYHS